MNEATKAALVKVLRNKSAEDLVEIKKLVENVLFVKGLVRASKNAIAKGYDTIELDESSLLGG